jgi:hypothetical protein
MDLERRRVRLAGWILGGHVLQGKTDSGRPLVTFVKEDFRMFAPPRRAAFSIFTNNDSKPDAGTTLAILAMLTQFQHTITQFVAHYPSPRWRRWSNLDRGRSG